MGRTVFVARVGSQAELAAVIADVHAHNAAQQLLIGERTQAEQNAVRPGALEGMQAKIAGFLASLSITAPREIAHAGTAEKWTRGDLIEESGALVRCMGSLWVELTNEALLQQLLSKYPGLGSGLGPRGGRKSAHGGADSTEFFERRRAAGESSVVWFGSRGKPEGFNDAPKVAEFKTLAQLRTRLPATCAAFDERAVTVAAPQYTASVGSLPPGGVAYTLARKGQCAHCSAAPAAGLLVCARCGVAQYCNASCQRADWRSGHKALCASDCREGDTTNTFTIPTITMSQPVQHSSQKAPAAASAGAAAKSTSQPHAAPEADASMRAHAAMVREGGSVGNLGVCCLVGLACFHS